MPETTGESCFRGTECERVGTVWQNPDFIQAVVTGQRHVSDLAGMDVKEMASESMKKQQLKYNENAKMALMDTKSYEKYAGKEINDGILKCPKCKSMKTEYTEVQTRSADEPTTKKCFCNTCNYRWKCAACHCAHAKASLVSPPIPCHQVLLSLRFFPTSLLLGWVRAARPDVPKVAPQSVERVKVVVHWCGGGSEWC